MGDMAPRELFDDEGRGHTGAISSVLIRWVNSSSFLMTSKLFSELGLSPALLKAIDRLGYEKAPQSSPKLFR